MKLFRFAGLLVIAAALLTGSAKSATASPPYACYKWCSGILYDGVCTGTLTQCCRANRLTCPSGTVFEGGDCTDQATQTEFCPS
jgi:hypothetical protein